MNKGDKQALAEQWSDRFLKDRGWFPVFDVMIRDLGPLSALLLGKVLQHCRTSGGTCRVGQRELAAEVGLSAKTVNRKLRELCEAGYLKKLTPGTMGSIHAYVDTGRVLEMAIAEEQQDAGREVWDDGNDAF